MLSVQVFLPCRFPCVVWRIEPSDQCEVAKENDGRANYSTAERKGQLKAASSSAQQIELSLPLSELCASSSKNRWSAATNVKQ
jgi:hypothetical protein